MQDVGIDCKIRIYTKSPPKHFQVTFTTNRDGKHIVAISDFIIVTTTEFTHLLEEIYSTGMIHAGSQDHKEIID